MEWLEGMRLVNAVHASDEANCTCTLNLDESGNSTKRHFVMRVSLQKSSSADSNGVVVPKLNANATAR